MLLKVACWEMYVLFLDVNSFQFYFPPFQRWSQTIQSLKLNFKKKETKNKKKQKIIKRNKK
jgi:hypothetical protein